PASLATRCEQARNSKSESISSCEIRRRIERSSDHSKELSCTCVMEHDLLALSALAQQADGSRLDEEDRVGGTACPENGLPGVVRDAGGVWPQRGWKISTRAGRFHRA